MAVFMNLFKSYLNNKRFWSYQEIFVEAVFIVWISSTISSEFSLIFIPQWWPTRIDSTDRLGLSRDLLGFTRDRCYWERALSFWKESSNVKCQVNPSVLPNSARIFTSYSTVYITVIATLILCLSMFLSVCFNTAWREPVEKEAFPCYHIFEKIYRKLTCKPVAEKCKLWELHGTHTAPCSKHCRSIGGPPEQDDCAILRSVWSIIKFLIFGIVAIPFVFVIGVTVIISWLAICVLPVVIIAVATARRIIFVVGVEAMFPCYALLACILAGYCTGRLMGFWMCCTYPEWFENIIKKMFCAAQIKKEQVDEKQFETVVVRSDIGSFGRLVIYSIGSYMCASYIVEKYPNSFSPFAEPETPPSATHANLNESSVLQSSMLAQPGLFPPMSPNVGAVCYIWAHILDYLSKLPIILLLLGTVFSELAVKHLSRQQQLSGEKRYPKWYTYLHDEQPKHRLSRCDCAGFRSMLRYGLAAYGGAFAMMFLPYPVLDFLVPEPYHLPVFTLITTAYIFGIYFMLVQFVWDNWTRYKRHSHDTSGRKLRCRRHPLCDTLLNHGSGRRRRAAGKSVPAEEQLMAMVTAVEMEEPGTVNSANP